LTYQLPAKCLNLNHLPFFHLLRAGTVLVHKHVNHRFGKLTSSKNCEPIYGLTPSTIPKYRLAASPSSPSRNKKPNPTKPLLPGPAFFCFNQPSYGGRNSKLPDRPSTRSTAEPNTPPLELFQLRPNRANINSRPMNASIYLVFPHYTATPSNLILCHLTSGQTYGSAKDHS
jgi:hypothetical protein